MCELNSFEHPSKCKLLMKLEMNSGLNYCCSWQIFSVSRIDLKKFNKPIIIKNNYSLIKIWFLQIYAFFF